MAGNLAHAAWGISHGCPALRLSRADRVIRWSWTIFVVWLVAVGAYYVGIKGERRGAINRWRPALGALAQGRDIYREYAFPTTPIMALILGPFTALSGPGMMTGWFVFELALTLLSLRWLVAAASQAARRDLGAWPPAWSVSLVLALASQPVAGDLLHGNVNLWIVFLVIAWLMAFRQGWDFVSGLILAMAAACKLTPAILIGYLAWKRAWRAVAGCLVGLLLWLIVVPGVVLGPGRNLDLLAAWSRQMVVPFLLQGQVETEQINQSLPGLICRLATPAPAIFPNDGRPPISIQIIHVEPATAAILWRAAVAAVLLTVAWATRRPLVDRKGLALMHEVGLVLIAMLLVSERTWKHHYVALLPTYAVLAAVLGATARPRSNASGWGLATLVALSTVCTLLVNKDLTAPWLGTDFPKLAEAYGAYVWAALLLAVAHLLALRSPRRPPRVSPATATDAACGPAAPAALRLCPTGDRMLT